MMYSFFFPLRYTQSFLDNKEETLPDKMRRMTDQKMEACDFYNVRAKFGPKVTKIQLLWNSLNIISCFADSYAKLI